MHLCLVIDNGPLTAQTYNLNNPSNNTNSNISMLETMKISVEAIVLHTGGKCTYHLFVTSNPYAPLSTFEHDFNHFRYQLKQIKNTNIGTHPAETIKYAIKHVTKFRVLTHAETVLGYRQGIVGQFAVVLFFSYGMTLRKILEMEAANLHKYFRSQDKFMHLRLCYPFQTENDKYKAELQTTSEYKKLVEISQKINKGEVRNIIKYIPYWSSRQQGNYWYEMLIGQGSKSTEHIRTQPLSTPLLCTQFTFEADINKQQFAEYFKISELKNQNFIASEDRSQFKINMILKNQINFKDVIPILFPFQISKIFANAALKGSQKQIIAGKQYPQIEQTSPIRLHVDLGKKLAKQVSRDILFYKYMIHCPNDDKSASSSKLAKLQKQLERLGITDILFPVYARNNLSPKKQFMLMGMLHYSINSSRGYAWQLAVTFPNFPMIETIINTYEMEMKDTRNVDYKKTYKLLNEYYAGLPDYYCYFLNQFFSKFFQLQPLKYESVYGGNAARVAKFKQKEFIQQILFNFRKQQKIKIQLLRQQNAFNHLNYSSTCCPIFADLNRYKQHCLQISRTASTQMPTQRTIKSLIEKVGDFNNKFGIKSYFGGRSRFKEWPTAKELQKSAQKQWNDGGLLDVNQSIHNNLPNSYIPGMMPTKKQKPNIQSDFKDNQISLSEDRNFRDEDLDSKMPERQYQQLLEDGSYQFSESSSNGMEVEERTAKTGIQQQNQNIQQYEIKVFNNIYDINSVAVGPHQENGNQLNEAIATQIPKGRHVPRAVISNEDNIILNDRGESTLMNKMNQLKGPRVAKRSSSIDYLQEEEAQAKVETINPFVNSSLVKYVNSLAVERGINTKIHHCNIRDKLYEDNIQKLRKIGLIKDARKYINFQ